MAATAYPKVPCKAWSALRSKAASAPSTKFSPPNVAAILGMKSAASARDNVVAHIRRLGLIDDDGTLTPRGNKWRIDASYADACHEILDEVYPEDLLLITDDSGAPDAQRVRAWFDNKGFGASNARQMAATYALLASTDIPASASSPAQPPRPATKRGDTPAPTRQSSGKSLPERNVPSKNTATAPTQRPAGPTVHLDIQIHIPAAASPEQIDHIFASMAKHLY
jgi:hypothetical protein